MTARQESGKSTLMFRTKFASSLGHSLVPSYHAFSSTANDDELGGLDSYFQLC